MKKIFILSVFCLILHLAFAAQISSSEAFQIASSWLSNVSAANTIADITPVTNPDNSSVTDWYLVSFTEGGFILISAEDRAVPILGFDLTNRFRVNAIPSNISWFLNQLHEEFTAIRSVPSLSVHPSWQVVRSGDFTSFLPARPVSPLIQTNWDQGWPYNSLCPSDNQGPGNRVYAGCAATTMGQIMKYWQHPVQGVGSHTYTHSTYGVLSANFGATTYNYASMPNSLWFTANTHISTLLLHCGVSVNMDYGPNGSGASISAIRPAFINFFNYETTAQTAYKSGYSATNWEALLRTELDNARPIFYFGTDTSYGGHAWVCDGYQGTNYFHMNWGWSGYNNGYFYLTNLNPGSYAFNSQQGAVIRLQPALPVSAPTNLAATVDAGNNIFLEWQAPGGRALLGYKIYKNGEFYTTVDGAQITYYFDINPTAGTYQYYVTGNFSQGESSPSNTVSVTVYPAPVINYQDSFENFSNFAYDLTPWFSYDLDLSPTLEHDLYDFPGEGASMSFIVFNPAQTVPPMTDIAAFNGSKMLACPPADGSANNDWFCSLKWNTGSMARLRFWAKSAFTDNGLAKFRVGISTTSPQPAAMTIFSGVEPVSVPNVWTEYNYIFSQYTYSNVFIGINCISDNGSMLLLDRVQLWSTYVENEDDVSPAPISADFRIYPNPFSKQTSITWRQKSLDKVSVRIYDIKGRLVKTLAENFKSAGTQNLNWDGTDEYGKPVANGIYYCRLASDSGLKSSQKLVLIK
ncbi:MAG: C10 family peptidase [Candidatus Cloacimonetes bacterium]|nr:C10 family peptidase [Candidatus Cloacimonadota bacterium]